MSGSVRFSGYCTAGRSLVSFAEWVRMDLRYIRSLSMRQDLKLLLLTVPAVVSQKGAR